ncbi:transposase [Muricoccus nepalensis]|uniref:transposase n=1 Tax=Muricoccus nepalensis TaxID=1854500 RepID=UPI0013875C74|nr:transposase [Roseomonas nepalensis]
MVEELQALRGVSLIVAPLMGVYVGDSQRFDNLRRLTAHLRLVPPEHESGAKRRQGAITKAARPLARRMLIAVA